MNKTSYIQLSVDDLLSRFPKPLTLYPSRGKWVAIAAGSLMFVATSSFLIGNNGDHEILGWIGVAFFGVGAILSVLRLLPMEGSLTLDRDGFEQRRFFFLCTRSHWRNVTGIRAAPGLPPAPADVKFVWYNDTQWNGYWLARRETATLGCNAGLADTYGLSAEELADLMMGWRQRALAL